MTHLRLLTFSAIMTSFLAAGLAPVQPTATGKTSQKTAGRQPLVVKTVPQTPTGIRNTATGTAPQNLAARQPLVAGMAPQTPSGKHCAVTGRTPHNQTAGRKQAKGFAPQNQKTARPQAPGIGAPAPAYRMAGPCRPHPVGAGQGGGNRVVIPPGDAPDPAHHAAAPQEVLVKFRDDLDVTQQTAHDLPEIEGTGLPVTLAAINAVSATKVFRAVTRKLRDERQERDRSARSLPALFNWYRLAIAPGMETEQALQRLRQDPAVAVAEPNYLVYAADLFPNDPIYMTGAQWHLDSVRAPAAWAITTSDTTQVIGIIDSGIDWLHPDLAGQIWHNYGEVPGNGLDDDGNGFTDDVRGWDFVNDDNDPADDNCHGTHVAGIAAAVTDNGVGVAGMAWNARLMPVKMLSASGQGNSAAFAGAIVYAAENGATVINMSVGSYARSCAVSEALQWAYSTAIPVAAAGNDFYNLDLAPMFPACYSYVVGVESSDFYNNLAFFSNFDLDGPIESQSPELFNYEIRAPGLAIYSTFPNGSYHALSGTSMSAPVVSGALALMKSHFPLASNEQLLVRLIQGTRNGILDCYNSLTVSPVPHLQVVEQRIVDTLPGCDRDGIADAGETVEIFVRVRNCGGYADSVWARLRFGAWEDTTVATITDSAAVIGDISEYATLGSQPGAFRIHIKPHVAHHREIVMQVEVSAPGSDTLISPLIIAVENACELTGVMDSTRWLTPDRLWYVKRSFRVGANGHLHLMPGTTLELQTGFVNRGSVEGYGTPDSLIRIIGPGAIQGGSWGFTHTHFINTLSKIDDQPATTGQPGFNRLAHCTLIGSGPWLGGAGGGYFSDCSFINSGYQYPDTLLRCNLQTDMGSSLIRPRYMAFNNFSGFFAFAWHGEPDSAAIGPNNILSTEVGYYFECPSLRVPPLYFGTTDTAWIDTHIYDDEESLGFCPPARFTPVLQAPTPLAHGMVWQIFANGTDLRATHADPFGPGPVKFEVRFNKPMDTAFTPRLTFGVREPFNRHLVSDSASWNSDSTLWTAWFTIGLETGDGMNWLRVENARDTAGFTIPVENNKRFRFLIQAAGSLSIPFTATPGIGRCILNWQRASTADVLGYNLYRYTILPGQVHSDTILVNEGQLLTDTTFTDYQVEPGENYHYRYRIVGTDMAFSDFSQTVSCIPLPAAVGDANGDGTVSVLDITTVTAFLLQQDPLPFLADAADVNNDQQIDVLDIVGITTIILGDGLDAQTPVPPVFVTNSNLAGNVMIAGDAFARPGDTVSLSVSIANTDPFISFQFDLPLPEAMAWVDSSASLTTRSADHVVVAGVTGAGALRMIAWSPGNAAFKGHAGPVVTFKLAVGPARGEFPLLPVNGVIGDSLSRNIMTGAGAGTLSVFPLHTGELPGGDGSAIDLFPNPADAAARLRLTLASACSVHIRLVSLTGAHLGEYRPGNLAPGVYLFPVKSLAGIRFPEAGPAVIVVTLGDGQASRTLRPILLIPGDD